MRRNRMQDRREFLKRIVMIATTGSGANATGFALQPPASDDETVQGPKNYHVVWFDAAHLKMRMPFGILLPQDYSTQTRRYPVLYLLHGGGEGKYSDYVASSIIRGSKRIQKISISE